MLTERLTRYVIVTDADTNPNAVIVALAIRGLHPANFAFHAQNGTRSIH